MPQQPRVLDGMRAPRAVRLEEMRTDPNAIAQPPVPPSHAPADVTVYVAHARGYRVQITAPQSYIGPDGIKHKGGKMLVAQFEDGVYRNNHHDPATRALIDETLQANPYFGPFGKGTAHFWLASDQNARMQAARVKSAVETLKSLPKDVVEQFLRQGDAEDHDLTPPPAAEPEKAGARPIPPAVASQ